MKKKIKYIGAYLRKRLRYWRLQADQEKTPLCPAKVGDMMLPSDFLQTFPSPSCTIPKLGGLKRKKSYIECTDEQNVQISFYIECRKKSTCISVR